MISMLPWMVINQVAVARSRSPKGAAMVIIFTQKNGPRMILDNGITAVYNEKVKFQSSFTIIQHTLDLCPLGGKLYLFFRKRVDINTKIMLK